MSFLSLFSFPLPVRFCFSCFSSGSSPVVVPAGVGDWTNSSFLRLSRSDVNVFFLLSSHGITIVVDSEKKLWIWLVSQNWLELCVASFSILLISHFYYHYLNHQKFWAILYQWIFLLGFSLEIFPQVHRLWQIDIKNYIS